MKTPILVGIVVTVHLVAVGSVILIQGCGTTPVDHSRTSTIMPPSSPQDAHLPPPISHKTQRPLSSRAQVSDAADWPGKTTMYIVGKGDSLSRIASRFGVTVKEIMTLNDLKNPNMIRRGRSLMLPGIVDVKNSTARKREVQSRSVISGRAYVVRPGDSLSVIAARHGTTVGALRTANRITGDKIMVGQELVIPEGGRSPRAIVREDNNRMLEMNLDDEPVREPTRRSRARSVRRSVSAPVELTPGPAQRMAYREITIENDRDDLRTIAMMWVVSIEELKRLNGLTDMKLKRGQKIKIPMSE